MGPKPPSGARRSKLTIARTRREELSLYRPNSNRVEQVQGPSYTHFSHLTPDHRGDGVLALYIENYLWTFYKTEKEKPCIELWSTGAGIKNWKKLGELPPSVRLSGDICPSANGKSPYVVMDQELGN